MEERRHGHGHGGGGALLPDWTVDQWEEQCRRLQADWRSLLVVVRPTHFTPPGNPQQLEYWRVRVDRSLVANNPHAQPNGGGVVHGDDLERVRMRTSSASVADMYVFEADHENVFLESGLGRKMGGGSQDSLEDPSSLSAAATTSPPLGLGEAPETIRTGEELVGACLLASPARFLTDCTMI